MSRTPARGLLAEYEDEETLVAALRILRAAGYRKLDAMTPYPSERVCEALALPRSKIPWITGAFGLTGAATGYLVQWWTQVIDDPLNVGGHAPHAWPAYIPITFETGVLFAGVATFFAFFVICGLPRLWHPLFEIEGVERASVDRYFLVIEEDDPELSARTRALLEGAPALRIERFGSADETESER